MASLYYQSKSPFYWIRYFDTFETDPNKKRKKFCTKIRFTAADLSRIKEVEQLRARGKTVKLQLKGNAEVNKILRGFEDGLVELRVKNKTGVTIKKRLHLSEAYEKFKEEHSVPGSKNELKLKTLQNYSQAVNHFIAAANDKFIYHYSIKDYNALLGYFEDRNSSVNTRSIYTRALHSLWDYFVEAGWVQANIIESTDPEEKDPDPIPLDEMYRIIDYLKNEDKEYPHHYWIIYFMLLTGCRPSSAIVQLKEDIDFKQKVITIRNVKAGKRKKKPFYKYPLYPELMDLLKNSMGLEQGDRGRLFDMYAVVEKNYTWPLSFWDRAMAYLYSNRKKDGTKKKREISRTYSLKQIRPTLASYLVNALKVDIYTVQKLLDHANIKVTDKHYVLFQLNNAHDTLSGITLNGFKGNGDKE
jgi:integrase